MNTLSDGSVTLDLPDGLIWSDQHKWSAVGQSGERTIVGKYIIDVMPKIGGRPITLQGFTERAGCARYSTVRQIQAWADTPGQELTLIFAGVTSIVLFRHEEIAFEATPLVPYSTPDDDDWFQIILRMMVKA